VVRQHELVLFPPMPTKRVAWTSNPRSASPAGGGRTSASEAITGLLLEYPDDVAPAHEGRSGASPVNPRAPAAPRVACSARPGEVGTALRGRDDHAVSWKQQIEYHGEYSLKNFHITRANEVSLSYAEIANGGLTFAAELPQLPAEN
jgi:hypothetical protein